MKTRRRKDVKEIKGVAKKLNKLMVSGKVKSYSNITINKMHDVPSQQYIDNCFDKEVIQDNDHNRILLETAESLDLHPDLVKDVVNHYLRSIYDLLHYPVIEKHLTITVYGAFYLKVLKNQKTIY